MLQYLVRHGESVSNLEGRVQGQEDVELSDLGRAQARQMAAWSRRIFGSPAVAPVTIGEVWSSPLQRARKTAAEIADALGLPLLVEEGLCELHAGIFQGHLWADLETAFPDEVARWRSGDVHYCIPGGESRAQLAARGRATLEMLAGRDTPGLVGSH